jgi:hypothetical protein
MTREEFDLTNSMVNIFKDKVACPDCGEFSTHPTPDCSCSLITEKKGRHIMKFHHTCPKTAEATH